MAGGDFLLVYVSSCLGGQFGPADCGPVWHLAAIGTLILVAVSALVALRLRAVRQTGKA